MPIRPDLRAFYRGPAWRETRRRIRERAGGKHDDRGRYLGGARCEQCGVLDRKYAARAAGWWLRQERPCLNCMVRADFRHGQGDPLCTCTGTWIAPNGIEGPPANQFPLPIRRIVMIVLTLAHLNHVSGDDRDENLRLLCQWCHLNYDKLHHHETRAARKDAARPLLQLAKESA